MTGSDQLKMGLRLKPHIPNPDFKCSCKLCQYYQDKIKGKMEVKRDGRGNDRDKVD